MAAIGWNSYSQMTVSRTEKHERPIRLSEARSLAAVLDSSVDEMLSTASGAGGRTTAVAEAVSNLLLADSGLKRSELMLESAVVQQRDARTEFDRALEILQGVLRSIEVMEGFGVDDVSRILAPLWDRAHLRHLVEEFEDLRGRGGASEIGQDDGERQAEG